jgi:hypothetical protein
MSEGIQAFIALGIVFTLRELRSFETSDAPGADARSRLRGVGQWFASQVAADVLGEDAGGVRGGLPARAGQVQCQHDTWRELVAAC